MTTATSAVHEGTPATPATAPAAPDGRPENAAPQRRPGRPRSDRAEDAILDAVFALFSEGVTYDALSMETIAGCAGVGKATIYRRWPNKEALVIEAISRRLHPGAPVTPPPGGSVRDDLVFLAERMQANLEDECFGTAYSTLLLAATGNERLWERYTEVVLEPRRELYRAVLRRGVAEGSLRADLDVERTMMIITSTILAVTRFCCAPRGPLEPGFAAGLVDDVLQGACIRENAAE